MPAAPEQPPGDGLTADASPADQEAPAGPPGADPPEAALAQAATPDAGQAAAPLPAELQHALELLTCGTAAVSPDGGLTAKLLSAHREGRPLRVKLGIDPSGSDLTLGHAVVLRKLRQFQDLGHLAVLIVGDFTGQVGDPTGKSVVRPALSAEQTSANAASYFDQVMRVLDAERVEVRRNSEWLAAMSMTDVIREARQLTVAQLMEREDFSRRFREGRPISLVEFLYPLLQGYDSVAVHADVELGGTDQTYNLHVGRELQRAHGQPPQVVLTVPLLEGLDGVHKMGKSLKNYVAIAEPPAEQFGKLMSMPDTLVERYAVLCTDLPTAEVERLAAAAATGGPDAAVAKRAVARRIVEQYAGAEAATAAEAAFDVRFKERSVPQDAPSAPVPAGDPVHLPALLRTIGLASSSSEARRLLDSGAIRLDGDALPPREYDLPRERLIGAVLQAGRRRAARLVDPA